MGDVKHFFYVRLKKKGLTCRDNGVVALRISATLHKGDGGKTKKNQTHRSGSG